MAGRGRPKKMEITEVIQDAEVVGIQPVKTLDNFELSAEIVAGTLTSNAKELRANIENELQNYKVEKYLDNPDAAKKDKAFLNKVKDAVSEKRKEVTAKWNIPLNEFLEEMKGLEKTVADASLQLKKITDEAENKEKEKKRKEIEDYWSTLDFKLVPLSRFFNNKWLNKTYSMKDVMIDCENFIEKTTTELETIRKTAEEQDKEIAQSFYLETLDLNSTLNKIAILKENRAKIKAAEEEKIAISGKVSESENNEKFPPIDPSKFNVTESGQVIKQPIPKEENKPLYNFNLQIDYNEVWALAKYCEDNNIDCRTTLLVSGTREQLIGLRKIIDAKGIDYIKLGELRDE